MSTKTNNQPKRKTLTQLYDEIVGMKQQMDLFENAVKKFPSPKDIAVALKTTQCLETPTQRTVFQGGPFIEVFCVSSGLQHTIRKNSILRWCPSQENGTRIFTFSQSMVITDEYEAFTKLMRS